MGSDRRRITQLLIDSGAMLTGEDLQRVELGRLLEFVDIGSELMHPILKYEVHFQQNTKDTNSQFRWEAFDSIVCDTDYATPSRIWFDW